MTVDIMDQSTWPSLEMVHQGEYLIVDLQNTKVAAYQLDQHPRVGDNMRVWHFAFMDSKPMLTPHKLYGDSTVTVYGSDAKGKIKILQVLPQYGTNWAQGRVDIQLPQAFFQTAGRYRRLMIEVKRGVQIEGTINFTLDVLPNDFAEIVFNDTDYADILDDLKNQIATMQDVFLPQITIKYSGKSGLPFIHAYTYNYGAGVAQEDDMTLRQPESITVRQKYIDSSTIELQIKSQFILVDPTVSYAEDGTAIFLTSNTDNVAFYSEEGFKFIK